MLNETIQTAEVIETPEIQTQETQEIQVTPETSPSLATQATDMVASHGKNVALFGAGVLVGIALDKAYTYWKCRKAIAAAAEKVIKEEAAKEQSSNK